MKKVSFIILSYNSERYIKDCIQSILNINKYRIHIYIIDNDSKDKSLEIIKSLENENITLIELEKNYGTTVSRNKGLHLIKETDYICVLDSDTKINEQAIEIMTSYLDKNKNVAIVGPAMEGADGEKQIPYRKFPNWKIKILKAIPIKKLNKKGEELENYNIEQFPEEFDCDYLISACWIMKYSTYLELGDFDEKIFYAPEDVEYCIRAKKKNYRIVHLRKAQIIHYYQRISKQKLISKANITHLIGLHYVLKKYKKFLKEYTKER